jgi:hypothetical protein
LALQLRTAAQLLYRGFSPYAGATLCAINPHSMVTTVKTSFGIFQGRQDDKIIQFQNIKYASLKDQLSVPEMVTTYGSAIIGATSFG